MGKGVPFYLMNKISFVLIVALTFFTLDLIYSPSLARAFINPEEALNHIGENQTVCGRVASTNYAVKSKGQPTFLNLNRPYPNHIFTVVIWGQNRPRFKNPPDEFFDGKLICVTGEIYTYRNKPQIEIQDPSQIRLQE